MNKGHVFKIFVFFKDIYINQGNWTLYYPSTIKFVLHLNFAVPPYQGDQLLVVFSLPQCVPGKVDQSECFIWSWQLENNTPVLSGSLEDPHTLVSQTFKKKKEFIKKNLLVKPSVSLNNSPNWICSVPSGSLTWKFITFVFAIVFVLVLYLPFKRRSTLFQTEPPSDTYRHTLWSLLSGW